MPELNIKDETLRTALMGAMATVVKDVNEEQRKKVLAQLVEQYKETGNKSWTVQLPSGDKVATLTLNESKAEPAVTDADALLEWCRVHRPELVETVEHPPVEGWTETRLTGAAVAHILEDANLAGTDYVTPDGELVEGLEFKPAPDPSKFTLTYSAKDRGLSVVKAWREGFIPIELSPSLPRIGAA